MSVDDRRARSRPTRLRAKRDDVAAMKQQIDLDELIVVARVVRVRGIKGEAVAELLTDFPERFETVDSLIALRDQTKSDVREPFVLTIERFWFQKNRVIFKFAGYDSIESASELIGCTLHVPESELVALEADEYYDWQLEGCAVETIDNLRLGMVREVLHTGGVPVLVIESDKTASGDDNEATTEAGTTREYLLPLAKTICVEVDVVRKLIRVDPPEGLLEI